ncbi:bis(5'-nucleosyl)-tetraphosphatase (symmetrical) YqeK [Mollicutes bacterium LVI A0078]|nr:bis(5'-nucleosyl)-tetraphosphatase (symmetrical) YqeK [Mollicutes bacterium LVI A0075]WOO90089.1 bis(5'-nucleosyl)-tetraphosphatase (symmetrical) YqeK [Mollicutes bacterium LVI A0078]
MLNLYSVVCSLQNEKRYAHTLGVVDMAKRIALAYNLDVTKVEQAALLHDVTKQISKDQQMQLLADVDDQFIVDNPPLWHSFTGSIYAQNELNVNDQEILEAIKYHTTGKLNCGDIAKVIYLSDYLELGRDLENLNYYRNMIGVVSLDALYKQVARARIDYELSSGHQLHSLTKELYESII